MTPFRNALDFVCSTLRDFQEQGVEAQADSKALARLAAAVQAGPERAPNPRVSEGSANEPEIPAAPAPLSPVSALGQGVAEAARISGSFADASETRLSLFATTAGTG